MNEPKHKSLINVGSASISYSKFGSEKNPTILFVHGFPMTSQMWKAQIQELEKSFYLIVYDMRGFGKSATETDYYTMETMANDLIELVESLGKSKLTLVGFSMGGYVALRAITKNPELFEKLILIDTQSTADGNEAKIKRHQAIEKLQIHGIKIFTQDFIKAAFSTTTLEKLPHLPQELFDIAQENTVKGLQAGLIVMMTRQDLTDSIANIKIPTLVLVGENDQITPIAVAQKLRDRIPNSELKVIKDAGHFSPCENPSSVNAAILDFCISTRKD